MKSGTVTLLAVTGELKQAACLTQLVTRSEPYRRLSRAEWNEVCRHWQEAEGEQVCTESERQARARKNVVWILKRAEPVAGC